MGYEDGAPHTATGEKPFQCSRCPKRYGQQQVLNRHYNEKHKPKKECLYADKRGSECKHKWTLSRTSEYRTHLRKDHGLEDVEFNEKLGPPKHRRPRSRIVESDLPPQFSPPPIEHDRQGLAEPKQRPLMKQEDLSELGPTHFPSKLFSREDYTLLQRYIKNLPRNSPIRFVHAFYIRLYT